MAWFVAVRVVVVANCALVPSPPCIAAAESNFKRRRRQSLSAFFFHAVAG